MDTIDKITRKHILNTENPDWDFVKQQYDRIKQENSLTDGDIEFFFGYAPSTPPGVNFRTSKRYRKVVTGIVRLALILGK